MTTRARMAAAIGAMAAPATFLGSRVRHRWRPFLGPAVDIVGRRLVITVIYDELERDFLIMLSPRVCGLTLFCRRVNYAYWLDECGCGTAFVARAPASEEEVLDALKEIYHALTDVIGSERDLETTLRGALKRQHEGAAERAKNWNRMWSRR